MSFRTLFALSVCVVAACADDSHTLPLVDGSATPDEAAATQVQPPERALYELANDCVIVGLHDEVTDTMRWLRSTGGAYVADTESAGLASRFFMKASDLGTYLFYDADGGYLVSDDGPILRKTELQSDVYLVDDDFVSGAEWILERDDAGEGRYLLRNRRTGDYFHPDGVAEESDGAASVLLQRADGCTDHPEMSLDAHGTVQRATYDDGTLFGFVDAHSHILTNFGFGGGGIAHGAPFHRLGVEHAMGDCELFHGPEGRADMLGWGFSDRSVASGEVDVTDLIGLLNTGLLSEPNHATDGWPTFSDWPSQASATHQTQYYRWLERAWMSGLRLVVQHAVTNSVFCELMAAPGYQPVRWGCEDMLNIDRQLSEVRRMERYIDAQFGGPGEGFFRIVETPAEAREVIRDGKMAVILGIEVPNLFDCYLTPRPDSPECDADHINSQLDRYYDQGIRVLFPNHKFGNAFTPGDGHRGIVELGNFMNSGHWSNYVQECPDVDSTFDKGGVQFGGFNKPRDEYLSAAPEPLLELSTEPLRELLPYVSEVREPPLDGDWCQKHGLTGRGRVLIEGIMRRGMIPELDHLPKRSYLDAFEILESADYPAAGTHGNTNDGKLFEIGGVGTRGFRRCADPDEPGSMAQPLRERRDQIAAAGYFPAIGFGFDLNGLAGVPDPRFGPDSHCRDEQEDPIEYPFESYAGDVTFTQPRVGERLVDFNTEGMIHIGLVPELVEDARRTGVSDEDMDILFKSAEAYIRVWERAEQRSRELYGED